MKKILAILVLSLLLSGCFTTTSYYTPSYVRYTVIVKHLDDASGEKFKALSRYKTDAIDVALNKCRLKHPDKDKERCLLYSTGTSSKNQYVVWNKSINEYNSKKGSVAKKNRAKEARTKKTTT